MYNTNFALMQHHKYSLAELENMIPFERELYTQLLLHHLEEEKRSDDSEGIIDAIKHIKGVLDVKPIVSTPDSYCSSHRMKVNILEKIIAFVRREFNE